jgi:dihydroflavonol-4-reductase
VQKACKAEKISAVILNPSTIYGAGDMQKQSRKIQAKVAQGRFPFYTSGGVSIVDVESVVKACLQAVEKGRQGERYILSGENISIKQLFSLIAKTTGVKPPFIHLNHFLLRILAETGAGLQKLGLSFPVSRESARLASLYHWFDHAKASQELNFIPMKAEQAIENSVKWWLSHSSS